MSGGQPTFPLVPRRRLIGMTFGTMRSVRRGRGSEVAGSRPYRRGDEIRSIDWAASARISAARGQDEFIVRERYADEGPRVVVVCDRSPGFSFFAPGAPVARQERGDAVRGRSSCSRAARKRAVSSATSTSRTASRGGCRRAVSAGWRRFATSGSASTEFTAPRDGVELCLEHLFQHSRIVTAGSFVFVCSDFLAPPASHTWLTAVEHLWDVIPIVIQDPVWEQSFPDVSGIVVPFRDPASGRITHVRLTAKEAAARRRANEQRLADLLEELHRVDLDPLVVSSSDPAEVHATFLEWTEVRRARRRGGF